MHPNQQSIESFYNAVAGIWRMLCDRWSRQALGAPGYLLGWTPTLRHKVRAQDGASLARFLQRNAH